MCTGDKEIEMQEFPYCRCCMCLILGYDGSTRKGPPAMATLQPARPRLDAYRT